MSVTCRRALRGVVSLVASTISSDPFRLIAGTGCATAATVAASIQTGRTHLMPHILSPPRQHDSCIVEK
jgi:hypothetical protein